MEADMMYFLSDFAGGGVGVAKRVIASYYQLQVKFCE
ncbi:hypothetical protein AEAC466_06910 [Asticcacaulis sp. AC466]|nr:hypothetical protein AEAC466_06910 [Asticcacaulis sp. AC466]